MLTELRKLQPSPKNTEILIYSPYPWCLPWWEVLRYWGHCCHLLGCFCINCDVCCWETCYAICHEKFKSGLEKYHIYFHRKCIFYTILHMHIHTIVHISKYRPTSSFFSLIHRANTDLQTWASFLEDTMDNTYLYCWILNFKALKKVCKLSINIYKLSTNGVQKSNREINTYIIQSQANTRDSW